MIQSGKFDSYMDIKKTANLLLNFAIKRLAEIFGILIFATGTLLLIALITYSPEDPNFVFPEKKEIKNLLGFQGSFISDLIFQSVGLISYLISFTLILTGINIFKLKEFDSNLNLSLPNVNFLIESNNTISINYEKELIDFEHLINYLKEKNLKILDISIDEGDLEDVFIQLTKN